MERKDFIKQCGKICLGGLIGGSLLSACSGNYYAIASTSGSTLTISKTEFFEIKNGEVKPRRYILVRTEKLNFPICVYKLGETAYSALLMECTHKSCELTPHGDYLICPCHGSEFNNQGKVQNPPAEIDLPVFKTTHNNENIYVHLS